MTKFWSNRNLGIITLLLAALLLVLTYYFSFLAGCILDGKQGSGGIEAYEISEKYSSIALTAVLAFFVAMFLAIYVFLRRNVQATLAVFLLVLTFGLPFTLWLSFEASIHGTQSCNPS